MLVRAAAEPSALVIGLDASAASMADASRRADRRGPRNVLFLAGGVEALADGDQRFAAAADLVTVTLPWGSLLRGVLGLDAPALRGMAAVARAGARVEVLVSVVPSDHVAGVERLDRSMQPGITEAWHAAGLELTVLRPATPEDLRSSGSSWARRLGSERPVWRLEGVRCR